MSYIGNPPVVQTNRLIYEEVVTVAGKTDFYPPGGYTVGANFLDVELNGNDLGSADFTATDGALVRLAVGAGIGDLVRIIAYGVSTLSNATPANGSVTTAKIVDANVTQAKLAANVAGTGPAFSASAVGTFSIAANTWTKLQFNTEQFDTNNNYDSTTNYRFTPTVAGYYQLNFVNAQLLAGTGFLNVYKNGATVGGGNQFGGSSDPSGSMLLYMNGSTDYVEVYTYSTSAVTSAAANAQFVLFQGFLAKAA